MSLHLSLNPIDKALHMHGTAHTSCSYSLSGSVHLTLSKNPSLFPTGLLRSRGSNTRHGQSSNIVLTSLLVTFEGKAEHTQEGGGSSAARLCTVSEELITTPVTLKLNDDQQHATHYDIIFDLLTIPGWLPSTFTGFDKTHNAISSTSYSLFATATYHTETSGSGSLTSTFCNIVNPLAGWARTDRKAHADRVEIEVYRHLVAMPPPSRKERKSVFAPTTFSITAQAKESSPIPNDVISRLKLVASIPSFVATSEDVIPISLKARFNDIAEGQQVDGKLAIDRVEIDVDQNEMFIAHPDDQYTSRFALPSEQPPVVPLLHRNISTPFEDLGFILGSDKPKKWVNCRSILDEKAPSSFFLDSQDGPETSSPHVLGADWSIIKMQGILRENAHGMQGGCSMSPLASSTKEDRVSPTYMSPFLRVTHTLNIALYVTYDGTKKDVVQFPLPVNFVALAPVIPTTPAPSQRPISRTYEPTFLPAYAQLFHDDGEARIDTSRGVPPAYRDKGDSEDYGRTVKNPELVPVGTMEVDWETINDLLG